MVDYRLIVCPVCEHKCSEAAASCPECGHPFKAPPNGTEKLPLQQLTEQLRDSPTSVPPAHYGRRTLRSHRVQTVEQTGKGWKLLMLFGGVLAGVGCGTAIAAASEMISDPYGNVLRVSSLVGAVGFMMYFMGRVGAWWLHG